MADQQPMNQPTAGQPGGGGINALAGRRCGVSKGRLWLVCSLLIAVAAAAPALPPPPPSSDDQLLALGRDLPGFGGLFLDADGRANVYLRDPERQAAAVTKSLGHAVKVLRADYSFAELVSSRTRLRPLLALPGAVFLDADEARNRVVIGVDATSPTDAEDRAALHRALAATGVPAGQVVIVDAAPVVAWAGLQSKVRPVAGGLQILFPRAPPSYGVCTLGFNAYRGTTFGFVINSHCTGTRGELDGMRYHQSLPSDGDIGGETVDPALFTGPPCPETRHCRYSDTAFASYAGPKLGALAKIARPTKSGQEVGSLTLKPTAARFTIVGKVAAVVGDVVHKVGRTTGWTYGPVVSTCADVNVSGLDLTLLCQHRVRGGGGPGDSGSPVFVRIGRSNNVKLAGILWGGGFHPQFGDVFTFSPLANVEQELGPLKVN